ncbi:hypothetical protein LCGC14_1526000, partial [marine sediment metagenome]
MKDQEKTKEQLISELEYLRQEKHEGKRAEEALRESEERLHLLFDSTHDLITLVDANLKTLWTNPAWNKAFATDLESSEDPFSRIHPDDLEKATLAWQALISGKGEIENLEYRFKHKNGMHMSFETSVHRSTIGGKSLFYVIAHDITERKQAEEALTQRLEFEKL